MARRRQTGMVRAALVGLGDIGLEVGRALMARPGVALLGAADSAPEKAGRDLGDLLRGAPTGQIVKASARELFQESAEGRGRGDLAILCTTSRAGAVAPLVEEALEAGLHVVSTCEELTFPHLRHARLAQKLDALAREKELSILGIGVNPGMAMDRLALCLTTACLRVDRVRVERVVDAASRRPALRAKVGAGLTVDEFRRGVAEGRLGHAGLGESAAMVARGLRAFLDEVPELIDPVVADEDTAGIPAGRVLGVRQVARAVSRGKVVAELHLQMSVGAADPRDAVTVEGDPPLQMVVPGGIPGDKATVAAVVNAIPYLLSGPPGLRTPISLPLFGLFPVRAMEGDVEGA